MKRAILFLLIIILLPSAFAASAKIIKENTAPGCYDYEGVNVKDCNVLFADASSGSVTYEVNNVQPATTYTVSFMYRIESGGSFDFEIDSRYIEFEIETVDRKGWNLYSTTFQTSEDTEDSFDVILRWSDAKLLIDELQFIEAPESVVFNNYEQEVGCCPYDFCYTGGLMTSHPSCVHSDFYEKNVSQPPIGFDLADFKGNLNQPFTFLKAPNGFRCIDGDWKFSRAKLTPLHDGAGFCPNETQCFIGGGHLAEIACVNDSTFHQYPKVADDDSPFEYHYCYDGNWTTRTKEIALQMLNMANRSNNNDYTIFCDKYDRSLNMDETMSFYRDFIGEDIAKMMTSGQVNEFCVMDLNGQIIGGVSLNQPIDYIPGAEEGGCIKGNLACLTEGNCDEDLCLIDPSPELIGTIVPPKSFIQMLKGPDATDYCAGALGEEDEEGYGLYHACDGEDVYYNTKLQNVIFTKPTTRAQSVPFEADRSFIDVIVDAIRGVFRSLLSIAGAATPVTDVVQQENLDFIRRAGSFDKLYLSYSHDGPNGNPRTIRAVRETRARMRADGLGVEYKTFLSAEYQNYQVPICHFFYRHNYHKVRAQISSADNIQCTPVILDDEQWMHIIYVEEPVFELGTEQADLRSVRIWKGLSDTFWNDITSKIRNQIPKDMEGTAPPSPTFSTWPDPVVARAKTNFTITTPESEDQRFVARTYDFGDGMQASSAYNLTIRHSFESPDEDPGYSVRLCVMNQYFRITCASPVNVPVVEGPSVSILAREQDVDSHITFDFEISGGTPPYNVEVNWGDEEDDIFEEVEGSFPETHEYDIEDRGDVFDVYVEVIDSTGVEGVMAFDEEPVSVRGEI
ncbi:hypothetical protein HQ545_03785 [Candidatus Woesearchaeota archaeon]|nr:hypothetical protein [Candidatus Woesearchaeota archaeon]